MNREATVDPHLFREKARRIKAKVQQLELLYVAGNSEGTDGPGAIWKPSELHFLQRNVSPGRHR